MAMMNKYDWRGGGGGGGCSQVRLVNYVPYPSEAVSRESRNAARKVATFGQVKAGFIIGY